MSLIARNIRLSLQGKTILGGVDFTAEAGALTAIVGPNGSGKTTLLKAMTGEMPADGTVSLNNVVVTRANAVQLATMRGVLPQASRIAFPFKVDEVIRIGHRAGPHATGAEIPARALAAVGLGGFAHRYYQELSGGEQQRVQLARVLAQIWEPVFVGQPCWLFLDEPVASLDIGHQLSIMELARDYARRGGGVVAVMHDLNLTAMYADQITVMKEGQVLASGAPETVMTDATLSEAYSCPLRTSAVPQGGMPFLLPQTAGA